MSVLHDLYFALVRSTLRHKGVSLGVGCRIWRDGSVLNGQYLYIGADTVIHRGWQINAYPMFTADAPAIHIGSNVDIGKNFTCYCAKKVTVGDDVLMGGDILVTDNNHGTDPMQPGNYRDQELSANPTTIEKGAWIGEKCCILAGVTIGERSIVGAGSVVTHDIPAYSIAVGAPASVIKRFDFAQHEWISVHEVR